jgi:hypothetical protein
MSLLVGYAEGGITNPKFTLERQADGFYWYTVTPGWEAYNAAHIAGYGITASESSPGKYTAVNPSPEDGANYRLVAAAGANLAVPDITSNANVRGIGEASSVDLTPVLAQLDEIQAKTDLLGTGTPPTVVTPVSSDGYSISLFSRDDYNTGDGRGITWTDTGGLWPYDFTGAEVRLELTEEGDVYWPMTIVSAVHPRSIRLELSKEQTSISFTQYSRTRVVLIQPDQDRITLFRVALSEI